MTRASRIWVVLGIAVIVGIVAVPAVSAFARTPTPAAETGGARYRQVFLAKLAALLGIDRAKLVDVVKQAAVQTIDQAVQDGRLTQDQANRITSRIQHADLDWLPFGRSGVFAGRSRHHLGSVLGVDVRNAIATRLGMTTVQLRQELRSGKTIAQIAAEKGVTPADLGKAVVDAVKPRLDRAVEDGWLTRQQADGIMRRLGSGAFLTDEGRRVPGRTPF